jgi:hypothetical protein
MLLSATYTDMLTPCLRLNGLTNAVDARISYLVYSLISLALIECSIIVSFREGEAGLHYPLLQYKSSLALLLKGEVLGTRNHSPCS